MKKAGKFLLLLVLATLLIVTIVWASCAKKQQQGSGDAAQKSDLIISEVMVSNRGSVPDAAGNHPDYVELYNTGTETLTLAGYALSDREDKAWLFPNGTTIAPGEYLVVWCTGETVDDALIANFKLSQGDVLRLTDVAGNLIVGLELPGIYAGYTYCYNLATSAWEDMLPSPGYPNTQEGADAYEQSKLLDENGAAGAVIATRHNGVYVSELMSANKITLTGPDGTSCDWIELYNATNAAVNLGGCGLSDDPSKPYKYTFADGIYIDAYSYLLLYCTPASVEGSLTVSFGLSSGGETLVLTDAAGGILDYVEFPAIEKDYSYARIFTESGEFNPDAGFQVSGTPSPGFPNTASGAAAFDQQRHPSLGVHDIRLNEVLSSGYTWVQDSSGRPVDRDLGAWIELYNQSDTAVSLSGFTLSDDPGQPAKWVFPDGTSIAGKGYLVLYLKDSLPLEGSTSAVTAEQRQMTLSFDLSGSGESLSLYDNTGALIDRANVPASRAAISYGRDNSGNWVYFDSPTQGTVNSTGWRGVAEKPVFSALSGIYHDAQQITITVPANCYVAYTTDCTTPTASSTRYQAGTAISVTQNTVIRARAFSEDNSQLASNTATATYAIVGSAGAPIDATDTTVPVETHDTSLPVIFLVTDPDNLFSTAHGIYLIGDNYEGDEDPLSWKNGRNPGARLTGANFNQRGREWERLTSFTYTAAGGTEVLYETDAMMRIFGAFSRWKSMKGFALIGRKGYGDSWLRYPFFDKRPFTEYKSVLLRCSAMDNSISRIRDLVIHGLVDDSGIDMANQAYVQCLVYLNGQYFAIYNLREKITKNFIAQHFGVNDANTIEVLRGNGDKPAYVVSGDDSTYKSYQELITYCKNHDCDLSSADAYNYVCSQIDVENYAMYCALEIIVGNTDTGNIKFWRSSELDNKWRWLIYDFDWAMNHNEQGTTDYHNDFFFAYFNPDGHGAGDGFSTVLSRSLLSNSEFIKLFLNACSVMYNQVFTPEKISAKVDELMGAIAEEMKWDNKKWELTYDFWIMNCGYIKDYGKNYSSYYRGFCQNYINKYTKYHLSDDELNTLFPAR